MRAQRLRILVPVQSSTSGRWTEPALKPDRHVLTIEYGQGDDVWFAGLDQIEHCYSVLVSWIAPYEERQWSCPAAVEQPCREAPFQPEVSHLEVDCPVPGNPSDDCLS